MLRTISKAIIIALCLGIIINLIYLRCRSAYGSAYNGTAAQILFKHHINQRSRGFSVPIQSSLPSKTRQSHRNYAVDYGSATKTEGRPTDLVTQRSVHAHVDSYSISETCITEELLLRRSNSKRELLLVVVDSGFSDMFENFYEGSLLKHNITNYLIIAMDALVCPKMYKSHPKIACTTCPSGLGTDSVSSSYGSKQFRAKINFRATLILKILELGFTVLHTDSDIVYFKNPFFFINCYEKCDLAYQADASIICAGFMYMKPTAEMIRVMRRRIELERNDARLTDQEAFNKAVKEHEKLEKKKLPTNKFLSGLAFWGNNQNNEFAADVRCPTCVIVHDNFIISFENKRYRLRESGLWVYDGNGYYSNEDRKYLLIDNIKDVKKNMADDQQYQELAAAFVMARTLNRTVIVPKFSCGKSNKPCSLLHKVKLDQFDKAFPDYREHSFLQHPKVPETIKNSQSPVYCLGFGSRPKWSSSCNVTLNVTGSTTSATASDVINWFGDSPYAVLRFSLIVGVFTDSLYANVTRELQAVR